MKKIPQSSKDVPLQDEKLLKMRLEVPYNEEEKNALRNCCLCPRKCGVNRLEGEKGFCNCGAGVEVALVCNHKGEEPVLSGERGICNVFFYHCNLQCVYCQNVQISRNTSDIKPFGEDGSGFSRFEKLIEQIKQVLSESENVLGFVSPTQHIPLMRAIIRRLHEQGLHPTVVYNTNGYDSVEQLRSLCDVIDVYLPDYKYSDADLSRRLSAVGDYPDRALEAIREMYRQKGSSVLTDREDKIESGLIVRHLVLPEKEQNSFGCLRNLSWISTSLTVSLMSQYAPVGQMNEDFLNRKLTQEEYDRVTDYFFETGFHKGFVQDVSSQDLLVPDFETGQWKGQGKV